MKKIVLLAFLLSACAGSAVTPESVVAAITKECGIVVTLADIAALITKDPNLAGVAGYAKLVCDALHQQTAPTATAAGGVVVVDGIPLHYVVK